MKPRLRSLCKKRRTRIFAPKNQKLGRAEAGFMATRESCLRIETIAEVYERRVAEHARERRARGKRQSLAFLHVKRGEPASEAEVRRQSLAIGGGFEVRASEGRALVDGRRHFEPCAVRRSLTRRRTRRLTWARKGLRLPRVHAASEVVAQFSRLAENATSGSKARRSRTIERPTRTSCARLSSEKTFCE